MDDMFDGFWEMVTVMIVCAIMLPLGFWKFLEIASWLLHQAAIR
jgi:hypothetical protein